MIEGETILVETGQQNDNELEARVRVLERDVAVAQADIKTLKQDLGAIKTNTTWLLRIVIGAIVMYLLKMIFEEGQATNTAELATTLGAHFHSFMDLAPVFIYF